MLCYFAHTLDSIAVGVCNKHLACNNGTIAKLPIQTARFHSTGWSYGSFDLSCPWANTNTANLILAAPVSKRSTTELEYSPIVHCCARFRSTFKVPKLQKFVCVDSTANCCFEHSKPCLCEKWYEDGDGEEICLAIQWYFPLLLDSTAIRERNTCSMSEMM